jgi:uncharacterized membrane protein YqhA
MSTSAPKAPRAQSRSRWLDLLVCLWMIAAQVWYYLQFREQLRTVLVPIVHHLWR